MRGKDHVLALRAVEEGLEVGILLDGSMENVDLVEANLSGARMDYANFSDADLRRASLSGTSLEGANLTRVYLRGANLTNATLEVADFSEANLEYVNLRGASLMEANLKGTNLKDANLSDANLWDVLFDETTILPDSDLRDYADGSKRISRPWTPETDMTRYTDPDHPDFWQPAYTAAGFDSMVIRANHIDLPRPWVDAGYGEDEWNEWVRDGKPAHKPTGDTDTDS